MSDTTDLMGVTADNNVDTTAPAAGAASGTTSRRRRSGTGLEGMVLAELQQVASGLGIRGTARMRKSQLIEVIKEAQAGSSAPKSAEAGTGEAETKPKRRATSKARTGDAAAAEKAEKAVAQQQIDIPGQPASDDQPAGERRRRRATAQAGSPDTKAEAKAETAVDVKDVRTEAEPEAKAEAATAVSAQEGAEGRRDRQDRQRGERGERGGERGRDR
ncbi:Rho termination factor N-terminal domain-containing protein, partial [Streptomyces sp.]